MATISTIEAARELVDAAKQAVTALEAVQTTARAVAKSADKALDQGELNVSFSAAISSFAIDLTELHLGVKGSCFNGLDGLIEEAEELLDLSNRLCGPAPVIAGA